MKKNVYLIRHGQTDLNKQGIVQGKGIDSCLNECGKKQAEAFYNAYKDVPFDKIYTSTLKRTHQTVKYFILDGVPWEQLTGLDEISWGVYEGLAQDEEIKLGFANIITKWANGELDVCVDCGESPNEVKVRQQEALQYILEDQDEKNILVCMHGRAMRMFLCLVLGYPFSEMEKFPHQNTALYKLEYEDAAFTITEFFNIDHLDDLDC